MSDFPFAAAATAVGAIGDYFSAKDINSQNKKLAREQMDFQRQENLKSMQFSERMSNTQWQRGVADMRAAGINPMLMATRGAPASSPSGDTSAGSSTRVDNPFGNVGTHINNAFKAYMLKQEMDNMQKQNQKLDSDILLARQNANTAKALEGSYKVNTKLNSLDLPRRENESKAQKSFLGKVAPYVSMGSNLLGDVIGAAVPVVSGVRNVMKMFKFGRTSGGTSFNRRTGEVE